MTQTELSEWYDVQRRTIYSWLNRLVGVESLEQAVSDKKRTDRKRKLTELQQEEFEDNSIVVLDGAPYFQASTVTGRQVRDDLAFVTLPSYSPDLNAVEECWRQLQAALSNRFLTRSTRLRQQSTLLSTNSLSLT